MNIDRDQSLHEIIKLTEATGSNGFHVCAKYKVNFLNARWLFYYWVLDNVMTYGMFDIFLSTLCIKLYIISYYGNLFTLQMCIVNISVHPMFFSNIWWTLSGEWYITGGAIVWWFLNVRTEEVFIVYYIGVIQWKYTVHLSQCP